MSIDLSTLSLPELLTLQRDLLSEIPRKTDAERNKVLEDMRKMAADSGFNLEELLGAKPKAANNGEKKTRGPVAVKYRSKDGQEWSGRGRKPAWIIAHLESGGNIDDLAA